MRKQFPSSRCSRRATIEPLERRQLLSADLTGVFTGKIPTFLPPAGKNKVSLWVSNVGDAPAAGKVTVTLYASGDQNLGGDAVLMTTAPRKVRIQPGKHTTLRLSFNSPSSVGDGNYYLLADIEGDASIGDLNSANNAVSTPSTISIRQPFVDLVGAITKLPKGILNVGTRHDKPQSITVAVTNNGNVPARGKSTISFYSSFDQGLDGGDVLLGTTSPKSLNLKPGKSKKITNRGKLPITTPSGSLYILAQVNSNGGIAESDTSNNVSSSAVQVTVNNPNLPPGPAVGQQLSSSVNTVVVGHPELAHFNVSVARAGASTTAEVDEVDSSGNTVGKLTDLFDDGSAAHGDVKAGDGIFSGINTISFDSAGQRFFVGRVNDPSLRTAQQTSTLTVPGVNAPTQQALQQTASDNAALNATADNVISAGGTVSAALDALNAALQADPNVQSGSIARSSHAIQWRSNDGILQSYDTDANPPAGLKDQKQRSAAAPSSADIRPADTITTAGSMIAIAPFAWDFEPSDESDEIAQMFVDNNYSATTIRNTTEASTNVTVDDFKNLGQYDAVVISSHGSKLPAGGETIITGVKATTFNMLANIWDLLNDRIAVVAGYLAITPSFITAYTGSMEGTIVYASACHSAEDAQMADAFLNQGAADYIGYTDSVNSDFSNTEGISAFTTLLKPDHNTIADIPGIDSDVDPGAPHAIFFEFGDETATLPGHNLLRDNDVYVMYSWPQTQRDLDTNTSFLGASAGYSLSGGPYLNWSGDNTSSGGTETTTVDVYQAWLDNKWSNAATVDVGADWYTPAGGGGPVVITVALESKSTGKLTHVETEVVQPGQETGGAHTVVGTIEVQLSGNSLNPIVTIKLT